MRWSKNKLVMPKMTSLFAQKLVYERKKNELLKIRYESMCVFFFFLFFNANQSLSRPSVFEKLIGKSETS